MSANGRGKIGDKELEYVVLKFISEHGEPKESEICAALPANSQRIVSVLKMYVKAHVLNLRQDDTSYTSKRYSLTGLGQFCFCIKDIDGSITGNGFKIVECGELDLEGKDIGRITLLLQDLKKKRWMGYPRPLTGPEAHLSLMVSRFWGALVSIPYFLYIEEARSVHLRSSP